LIKALYFSKILRFSSLTKLNFLVLARRNNAVSYFHKILQTYCLIFVLALNMVVPLTTTADDKILLCTSQGLKWVSMDEFDDSKPQQHDNKHCVLCLNSDNDIAILINAPEIHFHTVALNLSTIYLFTAYQQPAPNPRALSPPLSLYS